MQYYLISIIAVLIAIVFVANFKIAFTLADKVDSDYDSISFMICFVVITFLFSGEISLICYLMGV